MRVFALENMNVELVRRAFAAYAENGMEQVASFYPEDHVAYAPPEWVDESEYHGHDGLRRLAQRPVDGVLTNS